MEETVPKLPYDAVDRLLQWFPSTEVADPEGAVLSVKWYPQEDEL